MPIIQEIRLSCYTTRRYAFIARSRRKPCAEAEGCQVLGITPVHVQQGRRNLPSVREEKAYLLPIYVADTPFIPVPNDVMYAVVAMVTRTHHSDAMGACNMAGFSLGPVLQERRICHMEG